MSLSEALPTQQLTLMMIYYSFYFGKG